LQDCAVREVAEETGIKIKNIKKWTYTNDVFSKEEKHYITLYALCEYDSGEVKLMEPEKCEIWGWFEWGSLPEPLFIPIQNLLKEADDPVKEYYLKR
jgi:8-oxo-dGTP diphosphatase